MHPWIEGVRTRCALVWRYFYKPCTHCSGSDVARALGWQQLQSAVAVRRDSLADESKPPHAELCAIIAINMQALRGELTWWQFAGALSAGLITFVVSRLVWKLGVHRYSGASA